MSDSNTSDPTPPPSNEGPSADDVPIDDAVDKPVDEETSDEAAATSNDETAASTRSASTDGPDASSDDAVLQDNDPFPPTSHGSMPDSTTAVQTENLDSAQVTNSSTSDPKIKPSKLTVPQKNPFNRQAVKEYVFNETGNIMMASTELGSSEIQQSVRDVFAEVSVFFAAMTRAMATTINPNNNNNLPYSIYDYAAIESIVGGSGLFVQVSEEDIEHKISSWGVTVSKELIEGILGLATGEGELAFAQGLISSIGKRGLQVSGNSDYSDGRVGTIVFVCEYLLGMPIVSALVVYVDSKEHSQAFQVGPCVKEHSSSLQMTLHKDTYLFVTPTFIRKYANDLQSVETDLKYQELIGDLRDLLTRTPTINGVDDQNGNSVQDELTEGTTYILVGEFLDAHGTTLTAKFTDGTSAPSISVGQVNANTVSITPGGTLTTASPIGLYYTKGSTETLIAKTPGSFKVKASS